MNSKVVFKSTITMLGVLKMNIPFLRAEEIERVISVFLRVPGLILLDNWCHMSANNIWHHSFESSDLITFIVSSFVLIQGLLLILLPLRDLVTLYKLYLSLSLIAASELLSRHYVASEKQVDASDGDPLPLTTIDQALTRIQRQAAVISLHVVIAFTVSSLMELDSTLKRAALAVYTVPVVACLADFPRDHLLTLHNASTAVTVLSVVYYALVSLPRLLAYLRSGYRDLANDVNGKGLVNTTIATWNRVHILPQLLVFWAALVVWQLYTQWCRQQAVVPDAAAVVAVQRSEWYILVLYTVSEICVSHVSLAACCVTVMYASWAVLNLTKILAQGGKGLLMEQGLSRAGAGEGITMTLLALQTGLVDLPMPQRMGAMTIILFIVVGSLVQSMHELVEPVLLALSASSTRSVSRHARVLSLCLFLLVFPLYMAVVLCGLFDVDFWTLVVVSTCALTSVQVLGALTVYALFLYDSLKMDSSWEALDDVVYVARAVTRVLEFIVAVLVVGAGVRESMVLSHDGRPWSWLNGSVLAVHCYYNVFLRLQTGWSSFLLRRDAARKIHSLPAATLHQLQARSHDVCAICYGAMRSARVTPCQHLFHGACLKKWLYVQDRCPLCSARVTPDKPDPPRPDTAGPDVIPPL